MQYSLGTKMAAVVDIKDDKVMFLGFGEYHGMEPVVWLGGRAEHKIKLENGDIVWGCECHWGPANSLRDQCVGSREIIAVKINRRPDGVYGGYRIVTDAEIEASPQPDTSVAPPVTTTPTMVNEDDDGTKNKTD